MDTTINEIDRFIKYNHEKKALKFAYKKLKTEINKKIVMAKRKFFANTNNVILLGRKHCALIFMAMDEKLDDIDTGGFSVFNPKTSELKLWGLPIYVSIEDDYKIEIICNLGGLDCDNGLYTIDDPDFGLGKKPLIDIEDFINDLPSHMKIKRAEMKNN